jgi:hypothetical protein
MQLVKITFGHCEKRFNDRGYFAEAGKVYLSDACHEIDSHVLLAACLSDYVIPIARLI